MYKIRNFGNDLICKTLEDLKTGLQSYRSKSVSIETNINESEASAVHFVDVIDEGDILNSYGDQVLFEINSLETLE